MKDVNAVEKSLTKKDAKLTLTAWQKAESSLDAYLEEVELPPAIEMREGR